MVVVDASVYVAAHFEADRNHRSCLRWFESRLEQKERLQAPLLLAVEVAATVRRLTGDRAAARRLLSELLDNGFVELVPLTRERGRLAAEAAAQAGVRGADAVYLALAQELAAPLVTLDRQQLERGRAVATVRRPWTD